MAGNNALESNPPNARITITRDTSNWLWAVFSLFGLSTLIMFFFASKRAHGRRAFHNIGIIILTAASIAYFSMASDLGSTPVLTRYRPGGITRAIWYARYIFWSIAFPALVVHVLLLSGSTASEIVVKAYLTLLMFVLLLLGALVESSYKWAYFAFAIATYFYLVYKLHRPIRRTAVDLHGTGADSPAKPFTRGATYLSIIWPLYFVCWGLSEGGNVIKPLGEMVFYGVLDLITFAAFLLYHTNSLGSHDYSTWGSSRSSRHNGLGRDKATDVPAAHHI